MSQKSELFDLHCHSICSDGSQSPIELLQLAKKIGLAGLSITDHDTLDGYTPELFAEAGRLDMRLLVGMECSSEYKEEIVHILGYDLDLNSIETKSLLSKLSVARNQRNLLLIERLKHFGIDCSNLFEQKKSMGRAHLAKWLIDRGIVFSRKEAFELYLKEEPGCFLSSAEVIEAIHKSGGKAVLAHPHIVKHPSSLLRLPFDGLECYYARFSHKQNKPWLKVAQSNGWIITGGSDSHGANTPHLSLGSSWVDGERCAALWRVI